MKVFLQEWLLSFQDNSGIWHVTAQYAPVPAAAVAGISPQAGPVYGETEMIIKGLRFKPGKVQVRFGNTERTQLLVDAEYVDNETIKCKTANYEQFGATAVDVKVSINGEGWTVNKLSYSYFANTAARNCTAFGPGVLPNVVFGVGVPFLIQARDTLNERRTSGGDHFAVRVVPADGGLQGDAVIADLQDGRYEVTYSVPQPGVYLVHVSHAELGGSEAVSIRGSPFKVEAADPWVKHRVLGAMPAKRAVSGGGGSRRFTLLQSMAGSISSLSMLQFELKCATSVAVAVPAQLTSA